MRATVAAQLLAPSTPLSGKGEWNLLPLAGIRPPDSAGLGMFLHGHDRFSHFGGAAGFCSALTASCDDGTGAVVMTASGGPLLAFRLLRTISREHGWAGFRLPVWRRLDGLPGIRGHRRPAVAAAPRS